MPVPEPVSDFAPPPTVEAHQVNELLALHWSREFGADVLSGYRELFAAEHVVVLPGLCPPELLAAMRVEAFDIVDRCGCSHRTTFAITDGTPRNMTTVGQPIIKAECPLIDAFYFASELLRLTSAVAGERLHTCPYAGEHYVISRLTRAGDTHGWHWDDYTYGIILVLEAPHYRDGGFVQAVPNTSWDKQNPDVHGALLSSVVRSYAPQAGDAYLIETGTTMHRVYPIRGESRRTIVNMTLANDSDLTRPVTHETNDFLFGGGSSDGAPAASVQEAE